MHTSVVKTDRSIIFFSVGDEMGWCALRSDRAFLES